MPDDIAWSPKTPRPRLLENLPPSNVRNSVVDSVFSNVHGLPVPGDNRVHVTAHRHHRRRRQRGSTASNTNTLTNER
jgi:hypothetical protein